MTTDRDRALSRLEAHRFYRYRACAPDPDNPAVCQGDTSVPVDIQYGPDDETQRARHARERIAKRLCGGCPLLTACQQYAIEHERHGVWGGMSTAERAKAFRARQEPAAAEPQPEPLHRLLTGQRQVVLAALVVHGTEAALTAATGLDARTLRWQISRIASVFGLPEGRRDREHILAAAAAADVLPTAAPAVEPAVEVDDVVGQLEFELGDAARPRLRIVRTPTGRAATHCPAPAPLFTLDAPVALLVAS